MKWIKQCFAVLLLSVTSLSLMGEPANSCASIVNRLREKGNYDKLVNWVDENLSKEKIHKSDLELEIGTDEHPMCYIVKVSFDWSSIGMRPSVSSQVRIGCDSNGNWTSVSLGNLRFGVIVALSKKYGGKNDDVIYIDRRVAVYCTEDAP